MLESLKKRKYLTTEFRLKEITVKGPNKILYFLGSLFIPLIATLYVLFFIFKKILDASLHLYYGEKFLGVLNGADNIFAIEKEEWKGIVPSVMFVKSPKETDILKNVRKRLNERVFKHASDYPKLTSTHHKKLGYVFLLKCDYDVEECVKPVEMADENSRTMTREQFNDYIEKYGQNPLPRNNTVLWEVLVSRKPIQKSKNEFIYPVLFRWHHMAADGASLISLLTKVWGDNDPKQYIDAVMSKRKSPSKHSNFTKNLIDNLQKKIHGIGVLVYILYVCVGHYIFHRYLREKDQNALHGPKLSGKKILVWNNEEERLHIPIVKKIKSTVPNTAFSEVLFTALSASLSNYVKEKGCKVPETFYLAVPSLVSLRALSADGPAVMENNMSMAFVNLPSYRNSLLHTLKTAKEEVAYMRKIHHFEITYWMLNLILEPFPLPILSYITYQEGLSLIVSILPGTEQTTVLDGFDLDTGFFFTLNRWNTGVTMSIFSYDNRFQIGLLVDKALVPTRSDAQKIVDDVLKNIQALGDEVKKEYIEY